MDDSWDEIARQRHLRSSARSESQCLGDVNGIRDELYEQSLRICDEIRRLPSGRGFGRPPETRPRMALGPKLLT
jgi:hypothetical protein